MAIGNISAGTSTSTISIATPIPPSLSSSSIAISQTTAGTTIAVASSTFSALSSSSTASSSSLVSIGTKQPSITQEEINARIDSLTKKYPTWGGYNVTIGNKKNTFVYRPDGAPRPTPLAVNFVFSIDSGVRGMVVPRQEEQSVLTQFQQMGFSQADESPYMEELKAYYKKGGIAPDESDEL